MMGYAEKVRSQFLSLRHHKQARHTAGSENRKNPADFAPVFVPYPKPTSVKPPMSAKCHTTSECLFGVGENWRRREQAKLNPSPPYARCREPRLNCASMFAINSARVSARVASWISVRENRRYGPVIFEPGRSK